jgi:hypothetical protein
MKASHRIEVELFLRMTRVGRPPTGRRVYLSPASHSTSAQNSAKRMRDSHRPHGGKIGTTDEHG